MDYQYTIDAAPDYALLNIQLPANKMLKVEASAMASMDSNIQMRTKTKGGLKRFLTKESIFLNEFTAEGAPGEIKIAPGTSGDIFCQKLQGQKLYLTASSYLASTPEVALNTKFQGLTKGFFSGESFFLTECSGHGQIWFNTYGAIFEVDVVNDEYIVDTSHIVAFTEGLDYSISKVGNYKSLFFSGEGFVMRFQGSGKLWIQTKNPMAFVWWADQFRIVQQRSSD